MSHHKHFLACFLSYGFLAAPALLIIAMMVPFPTSIAIYFLLLFLSIMFFFLFADAILLYVYGFSHKAFVDGGDVYNNLRLISIKMRVPMPQLLVVDEHPKEDYDRNGKNNPRNNIGPMAVVVPTIIPLRCYRRSLLIINRRLISELNSSELTTVMALTLIKLKDQRLLWIEFFSFFLDIILFFPKNYLQKNLEVKKLKTDFVPVGYKITSYLYELMVSFYLIGSYLIINFLASSLFKNRNILLHDKSSVAISDSIQSIVSSDSSYSLITALNKIHIFEINNHLKSNLYMNLSPVGPFTVDDIFIAKIKKGNLGQFLEIPLMTANLFERYIDLFPKSLLSLNDIYNKMQMDTSIDVPRKQ